MNEKRAEEVINFSFTDLSTKPAEPAVVPRPAESGDFASQAPCKTRLAVMFLDMDRFKGNQRLSRASCRRSIVANDCTGG